MELVTCVADSSFVERFAFCPISPKLIRYPFEDLGTHLRLTWVIMLLAAIIPSPGRSSWVYYVSNFRGNFSRRYIKVFYTEILYNLN